MAMPYNLWQIPSANQHAQAQAAMQMPMGGMGGGGMGMYAQHQGMPVHNQGYAIPALFPSVSPMVVNPAQAIRDYAEHVISGDRRAMCSDQDKRNLEEWAKNDEYRKAIIAVIKDRLDLPWPYNYKALDILSIMHVGEQAALLDKVIKLNDSPATVEGVQHLKALAKGIVEKGKKEKDRAEEEEGKKRMAAVAEMWGGLWSNQPNPAAQVATQQAGWGGWPYPYRGMAPGVAAPAAAGPEWQGKAPEGWTPGGRGSRRGRWRGEGAHGPYGSNPTHLTPFSYFPFKLPPTFGPPVDPTPAPAPPPPPPPGPIYTYPPYPYSPYSDNPASYAPYPPGHPFPYSRYSSKITPIPQIYPFSRTGYYALVDPSTAKPAEKPKTWVSVGLAPRFDATASKSIPVDLGAVWREAAAMNQRGKGDGWVNMSAGTM